MDVFESPTRVVYSADKRGYCAGNTIFMMEMVHYKNK